MKNVLHFTPRVAISGGKVVLTAPHNIRDRVWNITNTVHDFYVFSREGGNGTQIFFEPNAGYDNNMVAPIVLAATYLATINEPVEVLWSISMQSHFQTATSLVYTEKIDLSSEESFSFMIETWVLDQAVKTLNRDIDRAFRGLGYNESVIQSWISETIEAYRRLGFTPRPNTDTIWVVGHLDSSTVLGVFHQALSKAKEINKQIAELKAHCSKEVEIFKTSASLTSECADKFVDLKSLINDLGLQAIDANSTFGDEDVYQNLIEKIRLMTPPAPSKK